MSGMVTGFAAYSGFMRRLENERVVSSRAPNVTADASDTSKTDSIAMLAPEPEVNDSQYDSDIDSVQISSEGRQAMKWTLHFSSYFESGTMSEPFVSKAADLDKTQEMTEAAESAAPNDQLDKAARQYASMKDEILHTYRNDTNRRLQCIMALDTAYNAYVAKLAPAGWY